MEGIKVELALKMDNASLDSIRMTFNTKEFLKFREKSMGAGWRRELII